MPNKEGQFTQREISKAELTGEELKVATLRGYIAPLSPDDKIPYEDLGATMETSDAGTSVTLGEIEAAMVEKVQQALANGTIPQNTRGSSEIQ